MLLGRQALGTVAYLGGLPAVLEQFTWSFAQLVQYNEEFLSDEKHYVHYMRSTFSDHGPARNNLVAKFCGEWLLQLDTDHSWEPDLLARILRLADEARVGVVSGVYQFKQPPHAPVLFQWTDAPDGDAKEVADVHVSDDKVNAQPFGGLQPMAVWPKHARLLQIGSAGGGCLFVRRKVFARIVDELKEQPFDKCGPYSEDHSFFFRCRKLGIKCYAAMNVHCHHLAVNAVTLDDYQADCAPVGELFSVGGFA